LVFNPHDVGLVSQIFFKEAIEVQLYSSAWGIISEGSLNAGRAIEGAIFSTYTGSELFPTYSSFVKKYEAKYKSLPDFAAIFSYEAAMMYFEALEQADSFSKEDVRKSLLSLRNIEGVLSELEFDQYGDIERRDFLSVIRNGQLEVID
jgi:branched-chain amino acid transport system substrate-binding protein